jgi:hypothetical protein
MNKLARYLLALAAVIASLEAASREAEPPEPDCPAVAPCTGPQLVALPPDGPDSLTDTMPPATAQIVAASGPAALASFPADRLPFFIRRPFFSQSYRDVDEPHGNRQQKISGVAVAGRGPSPDAHGCGRSHFRRRDRFCHRHSRAARPEIALITAVPTPIRAVW